MGIRRELVALLLAVVGMAIGYGVGRHGPKGLLIQHGRTHEFVIGSVRCGAPVTYLRARDSILVATNEPSEIQP